MAETDQDQKTEQASDKRREDAHDRGQFARSQEMPLLFAMVALMGVLGFTVRTASRDLADYAISIFSNVGHATVGFETVPMLMRDVLWTTGRALGPVLIACAGAALLSGGVQSGFRLTPEAMALKWEQLNPVAGFQKLFSKSVLVRAGIDFLKLIAVGGSLYLGARGLMMDPLFSAPVEAGYLGHFLGQATLTFLSRLIFALGIITALSYAYERFKTSRELMMTREEIKEERKQAEGDAHTKAAMRRMARRLLQKQMLAAVQTADVVITNPTHYAVALKYERGKDQAPVVLAKGENRFAQRIKALAAEHGVPLVENKPVARVLFALGRVGEAIPSELYQAVAEILAVVYRTHRYYFHRLKSQRLEAIG